MSELNSVKVSIGNRAYPIRVSKDEEEKVMMAAQTINSKLKEFEENYAVKDKQDLLAMCVLQYATESIGSHKKDGKKDNSSGDAAEQIDYLNALIDDYLASETPAT